MRRKLMYDHYTVTSTDGDRQYIRTVIAANGRDAEHTHHEHYPHATVTAVAEAHEQRASDGRQRGSKRGPVGR
jgi:hypothetical protein